MPRSNQKSTAPPARGDHASAPDHGDVDGAHAGRSSIYTLEGDSKKAFSADLTITNTGDAPYTAWELGFEFAEKQTVRSGHDAWWHQEVSGHREQAALERLHPAG